MAVVAEYLGLLFRKGPRAARYVDDIQGCCLAPRANYPPTSDDVTSAPVKARLVVKIVQTAPLVRKVAGVERSPLPNGGAAGLDTSATFTRAARHEQQRQDERCQPNKVRLDRTTISAMGRRRTVPSWRHVVDGLAARTGWEAASPVSTYILEQRTSVRVARATPPRAPLGRRETQAQAS